MGSHFRKKNGGLQFLRLKEKMIFLPGGWHNPDSRSYIDERMHKPGIHEYGTGSNTYLTDRIPDEHRNANWDNNITDSDSDICWSRSGRWENMDVWLGIWWGNLPPWRDHGLYHSEVGNTKSTISLKSGASATIPVKWYTDSSKGIYYIFPILYMSLNMDWGEVIRPSKERVTWDMNAPDIPGKHNS